MLHIFVLMMCNCTIEFAKMRQYGTVGISTLGNIFQKCPKSLNSADFHKSLPQGNFCLFREIQWNQQTSFLWTQFHRCWSARVSFTEMSATNGVKAQTPDWVTLVQRVAAPQLRRELPDGFSGCGASQEPSGPEQGGSPVFWQQRAT